MTFLPRISSKFFLVVSISTIILSIVLITINYHPYSGVETIILTPKHITSEQNPFSHEKDYSIISTNALRGKLRVRKQKGRQGTYRAEGSTKKYATKTIFQIDSYNRPNPYLSYYHEKKITFDGCEYSNCIVRYTSNPPEAFGADLAILYLHFNTKGNVSFMTSAEQVHRKSERRKQKTVWLVNSQEPPAYDGYKWQDMFNSFDGAASYQRHSMVYRPYGKTIGKTAYNTKTETINYAVNKTKGAFAYVSHCSSKGFNRLKLMQELGKYIDVDIYGQCTNNVPCRGIRALDCIHELHSKYHFYLSFENSLCKDYITEKFWKVLKGEGHYIPVAIGGLSLEDYEAVTPQDSFLHVYNFSSIEHLGRYMKLLTQDKAAFNRYHEWRNSYDIDYGPSPACKYCEIANFPTMYKRQKSNIAQENNDPENCRELLTS